MQWIGDVYQLDVNNEEHKATYGSDKPLEVAKLSTWHKNNP